MARITLDTDKDHLVTPLHSDARGPVVRGQSIEVMQMNSLISARLPHALIIPPRRIRLLSGLPERAC